MITHDLYVYKNTNVTDTTTNFMLNIQFKTDPSGITAQGFIPYPLYCTVDGEDRQLRANGDITIKAGQQLLIPKIPENAVIQITETLPDTSAYAYTGTDLAYNSGAAADTPTVITGGIQFAMGTDDMKATVNNKQSDPVMISHNLKPNSVGDADTYVTAVVKNEAETEDLATYAKTPGIITVDPQYIKKGSTDKLAHLDISIRSVQVILQGGGVACVFTLISLIDIRKSVVDFTHILVIQISVINFALQQSLAGDFLEIIIDISLNSSNALIGCAGYI